MLKQLEAIHRLIASAGAMVVFMLVRRKYRDETRKQVIERLEDAIKRLQLIAP